MYINDYSDDMFELRQTDLANLRSKETLSAIPPLERKKYLYKQAEKFKFVNIKICFPDRQEIHAKFSVMEKIKHVKALISQTVSDSSLSFRLFTTPPKKILDENITLFKEGLYPSAKLYLEWTDNSKQPETLLRDDIELYEPPKEPEANPEPIEKPIEKKEKPVKPNSEPKKKSGSMPAWFLAGRK